MSSVVEQAAIAEKFNSQQTSHKQKKIIIIGAGMSGMLMAIQLKAAGIENFEILEKAEEVGGTWRDNTYPGLACDVPGYMYTYSFEPNSEFANRYATGEEIKAYFLRIFHKYQLDRYIRYQEEVISAEYTKEAWNITTVSGLNLRADILISAVGVLHQPNYPDLPGLDTFQGAVFHSARWNHAIELNGQRVGVVGTGSTAVQIVCGLVDQVAQLKLFQRTPQWVLPAFDKKYHAWSKKMVRYFPAIAGLFHNGYSAFYNSILGGGFGRERRLFIRSFKYLADRHLNTVTDPVLRKKLTPDYPFGCKRFILSDNFYKAVQQPKTQLITDAIERIEATGVRTKDGNVHELDVLVLATGFKAQNYVRPIQLTGTAGKTLEKAWEQGVEAYHSVAIPGFPNFFMLQGPHSPIGNFSLIKIAELQSNYLMQLITGIVNGAFSKISPRADATDAFNEQLRAAAKNTVWLDKGCNSWYIDRSGHLTIWPWSINRFESEMAKPNLEEFEIS